MRKSSVRNLREFRLVGAMLLVMSAGEKKR